MIRLLEDGTIGFGEIYSGFVGGEFPVFEAANLWGAYESVDQWFEASEALEDDIHTLVTRETGGGEIVGFNYYSSNYFFTKGPLNTLADFKGVKTGHIVMSLLALSVKTEGWVLTHILWRSRTVTRLLNEVY